MDLPSFEILAAALDDDDDVMVIPQDDPFAPLPLDQPLEDSLLSSSIACLLNSPPTVASDKFIPTFCTDALAQQQQDQMDFYTESLASTGTNKAHKKHKAHKKNKKSQRHKNKFSLPVPARPQNAYELFCQHVRTQLLTCDIAYEEWDEIVDRRWKSIDEATKSYFQELADHEQASYKTAMTQYKKLRKTSKQAPSQTTKSFMTIPSPMHTCLIEPTFITPTSSCNDLVYTHNYTQASSIGDLAAKLGTDSTLELIKMFS